MTWLWLALLALIALCIVFWLIGRAAQPARVLERVRPLFQAQQTDLHAAFMRAASESGKPRGLRWVECQWGDSLAFGRDRRSRQIVALAAVTIRFEAIEGSDMEGLPAVANLRNASAVFALDGTRWRTEGRAVFNLDPDEALAHFGEQYEKLAPSEAEA